MASRNPTNSKDLRVSAQPLHFKNPNTLISIEGAIGVGKTSLSRMLATRWNARSAFEVFEENPFLTGGFYEKTSELAFNTEIFFLLTRFKQQKALSNSEGLLVADYFFEKNLIFAEMNLSGEDLATFRSVYDQFLPQVRSPDLIVFLQADLETIMRRIYFRDRNFERSISPAYIEQLMTNYYRFLTAYSKAPVLTIQTTGLDFVNDPQDFQKVCALIEDRLSGQVQLSLSSLDMRAREAHA